MSTDIKPIETHYAGCRFRSRLEARWAVFFDTHGIKWEYEAQGFDLPIVGRYLPDFWLPEWKAFVEIKGLPLYDQEASEREEACRKLAVLSIVSGNKAFLVTGNVGPDPIVYMWDTFRAASAVCRWGRCRKTCGVTVFHFWSVGKPICVNCYRDAIGDKLNDDEIYTAARSARFEFGETPAPMARKIRAKRA